MANPSNPPYTEAQVSMKLTNYTNSFFSVEIGNRRIVCDPWIGIAEYNAWMSYPIFEGAAELMAEINPDLIYISHIHTDHFDKTLLSALPNKNIPIYIKMYQDHRLFGQIKELGFTNIVECEEWKTYTPFPECELTIIPADTSNSDNIASEIFYDIDSCIIIKSNLDGQVFFNNVDTPLTPAGLQRVREFISEKYKTRITYTCFAIGAASEYPHCFLNIDREAEKARINKSALEVLDRQLKILNPEVYINAGGWYIVFGKFYPLNKNIAQPETEETIAYVKKHFPDIVPCSLDGGHTVFKSNGKIQFEDHFKGKRYETKPQAIAAVKDRVYPYVGQVSERGPEIADLFEKAKAKYLAILEKKNVPLDFEVKFFLYEDLRVNEEGNIPDFVKPTQEFTLAPTVPTQLTQTLECHLDSDLFVGLLKRTNVWNISLSGTYILFKRTPNVFIPSIPFSLNFLTI